jgi:predicted RecA/RadA family phage recombinase
MFARPRPRTLTCAALALGFALLGSACDGDSSNPPGDGGGDGAAEGGKPAEGGLEYTYAAEGFTLTATTKVKLELSSNQGQGTAELSARSLIEASPTGDKLKTHGKVVELLGYTGSGQLDPEFMRKQAEEAGEEAMDIEAELAKSEAWTVVNLKGETDEDATKALSENQAGDEGAPVNFGLFGLPDLPAVDLEVGEKVKLPTEAAERQLPFGSVPVEVDTTWTLRGVNGTIAELDVTTEGSGATEFDAGGAMASVSMLEESSYTVFFDMETKLPVSFNGYSASEIQVDAPQQSIQFATNNEVETTFEVGAPAAAPAGEEPAGEEPAAEAPAAEGAAS